MAAGYATIQFKYDVQALERELTQLDAKILRHQEAIHVLKAEWAFLNEPARERKQVGERGDGDDGEPVFVGDGLCG